MGIRKGQYVVETKQETGETAVFLEQTMFCRNKSCSNYDKVVTVNKISLDAVNRTV